MEKESRPASRYVEKTPSPPLYATLSRRVSQFRPPQLSFQFHILTNNSIIVKMSDYEDDMDVDVPVSRDVPMFSAESNSRGKRSAANLPVEAEDSLPWSVVLLSKQNIY